MKRKSLIFAVVLTLSLLLFGAYFPNGDAHSQTIIACPNSGVECKVTIDHPEHGKFTIISQKGKYDDALKIIN